MHEDKLVDLNILSMIIHKGAQKNPCLKDYKLMVKFDDLINKILEFSPNRHQAPSEKIKKNTIHTRFLA